MSDINAIVEQSIQEDKGQTAGAEMFNKGKIAGLYSEPGLDAKDGTRGKHTAGDSGGEKVEKQYGTDQSKFHVDGSPGNSEPKNPSPNDGGTPPVNKFGGNPMFAAAEKVLRQADSAVIKSPEVKSNLKDQPGMPTSAPK
jgi:hypothetical protein